MARRTLIAHELRFHKKFARKNVEVFKPCDLKGESLIDVFLAWCNTADREMLCNEKQNVWLNIESARKYSPNIVLAELAVGKWGEEGKLLESQTGKTVMAIGENQAATGSTRVALFVPPIGDVALFFSESSNRGCGGSKLLPKFASYWSKRSDEITMVRDRLVESEQFLDDARVKEIEIRYYTAPSDVADSFAESFGYISHTIHSKRRSKGFPPALLTSIKEKQLRASRYVGIPEDESIEQDVYITLQVDGKTKKIALGDPEDGFFYREVLNDWGEQPLDHEAFINYCSDKAADCLSRMGAEWKEEWSRP